MMFVKHFVILIGGGTRKDEELLLFIRHHTRNKALLSKFLATDPWLPQFLPVACNSIFP